MEAATAESQSLPQAGLVPPDSVLGGLNVIFSNESVLFFSGYKRNTLVRETIKAIENIKRRIKTPPAVPSPETTRMNSFEIIHLDFKCTSFV